MTYVREWPIMLWLPKEWSLPAPLSHILVQMTRSILTFSSSNRFIPTIWMIWLATLPHSRSSMSMVLWLETISMTFLWTRFFFLLDFCTPFYPTGVNILRLYVNSTFAVASDSPAEQWLFAPPAVWGLLSVALCCAWRSLLPGSGGLFWVLPVCSCACVGRCYSCFQLFCFWPLVASLQFVCFLVRSRCWCFISLCCLIILNLVWIN